MIRDAAQIAQCTEQRGWWYLGGRRQWRYQTFGDIYLCSWCTWSHKKAGVYTDMVLLCMSAVDHVGSVVWLNQRWVCFGCGVFVGCGLVPHSIAIEEIPCKITFNFMGKACWTQGLGEHASTGSASSNCLCSGVGRWYNSVDTGETDGPPVKPGVSKKNQFCKIRKGVCVCVKYKLWTITKSDHW